MNVDIENGDDFVDEEPKRRKRSEVDAPLKREDSLHYVVKAFDSQVR